MKELELKKKKDILADLKSLSAQIRNTSNECVRQIRKLREYKSLRSKDEFFNHSVMNELLKASASISTLKNNFLEVRESLSGLNSKKVSENHKENDSVL